MAYRNTYKYVRVKPFGDSMSRFKEYSLDKKETAMKRYKVYSPNEVVTVGEFAERFVRQSAVRAMHLAFERYMKRPGNCAYRFERLQKRAASLAKFQPNKIRLLFLDLEVLNQTVKDYKYVYDCHKYKLELEDGSKIWIFDRFKILDEYPKQEEVCCITPEWCSKSKLSRKDENLLKQL